MATEVAGMPNGTYATQQTYQGADQNAYAYAANNSTTQPNTQQPPAASSTPSNAPAQQQPEISKDEVGWYFVEQYYTTLSRSPEKLYLFYNKRSQFVSGPETDKVQVCIGQRAINDKIKELDFQDCKVRVTNVDSQSSDSNIVIQVIGEISNKSQPHRKFTQTFVLATQTNGYFVLNDIFRYLVDEEDEPETESAAAPVEDIQQVPGTESGYLEPPPTAAEPKAITSSTDSAAVEPDANQIDKEIEEKIVAAPVPNEVEPRVNGDSAKEVTKTEDSSAAPTKPESSSAPEAEKTTTTEPELQAEKPKDPEPTPAASPPKQTPPQPAPAPKPAAPAAPMSWASRAAAANRVATPAAPSVATPALKPTAPSSTASKPASQATTPAPAQPAATSPAPPTGPAAQRQDTPDSTDDWATVGHNRQQSRQANTQQPEQPQYRGYIKNVHDSVNQNELQKIIEENFGELAYIDIARQKNCAFVDFKTGDGYNKALTNSFKLGDETLQVEERRFKPGSTPYIPRGNFQGRGRGNVNGQGSSRGGYNARGGNGAPRGASRGNFQQPRGRGGAQA